MEAEWDENDPLADKMTITLNGQEVREIRNAIGALDSAITQPHTPLGRLRSLLLSKGPWTTCSSTFVTVTVAESHKIEDQYVSDWVLRTLNEAAPEGVSIRHGRLDR